MMTFSLSRMARLLTFVLALIPAGVFAASESYVQSLTGHLKKGDSLTVIDDKFLNLPLDQWNQLKHLSVIDLISFELRRDTLTNYFKKAFSCTLNVTIKYFTSRDEQQPKEIDSVNLVVRYDTAKGKAYVDVAHYRFKNAFKVTVVINSISSPEWKDKLPDCFRLKSQIFVDRQYPFDPHGKGKMHLGAFQPADPVDMVAMSGPREPEAAGPIIGYQAINGQLVISWAAFGNGEDYDLEWTYVDAKSPRGVAIFNNYGGTAGPFSIPEDIETGWMVHDATRVTLAQSQSPYTINLPYQDGYVLIRIRAATYPNSIRFPGDWMYADDNGNTAVAYIQPRQANLNYQYTGTFAEGGKRKEIMSYADASLRTRQNVTINNSDLTYKTTAADEIPSPTALVQETIYDVMGRASVNVMPAPIKSSLLDYVPSFNLNGSGAPYSFADITPVSSGTGCAISGGVMSTTSGASQYYSPSNGFLDARNVNQQGYTFNPYIPDAQQYPFSVRQYLPDNTGRIAREGGVGLTLQTGGNNDTKNFYGKPTQTELQRMFGQEVGDASHYLKNMVIDPNGQASLAFIDTRGKIIATALAGPSPANKLYPLASNTNAAMTSLNDVLIKPADFSVDAGSLGMSATTTFMAETSGSFSVIYSVNPLALTTTYANGTGTICSNCYYSVVVTIRDPCGTLVSSAPSTPFQMDDFTCHINPQPVTQTIPFTVSNTQLGTWTVSYSLQLSEQAIVDQTNYYIATNTDLSTLQTFFLQELNALDLSACYSSCNACQALGSSVSDFQGRVLSLLATQDFTGIAVNSSNPSDPIMQWIASTYSTLKAKCAAISCAPSSPCDQKLSELEQDVLPGGQYALYDANALANGATTVFLEPATNVMEYYNQDPAISSLPYTTVSGTATTVGNLNQADFVRAYLQNPQWASLFVVHHIEYCSYLWCKDASNSTPASDNEVSYTFDANLQQNYQDGSDAANAGYYNHADPFALLKLDPWFNGAGRGATYYANMQADLQNLTTAISVNPTDQTVSPAQPLPVKNIIQYIDWVLYCAPAGTGATAADLTNSWNNCSPSANCRSVTLEWQLYLQYYMQLKSKYYRIAKLAYFQTTAGPAGNPGCLDCFIGADALATAGCVPPDVLTNYQVVHINSGGTCGYYIVYNNGNSPFPSAYAITYSLTNLGTTTTGTVNCNAGDMRVPIFTTAVGQGQDCAVAGTYQVTGIVCAPTALASCAATNPTGGSGSGGGGCPAPSSFSVVVDGPLNPNPPQAFFNLTANAEYVDNAGPVNTAVTVYVVKNEVTDTYPNGGATIITNYPPVYFTVTLNPGQSSVVLGTDKHVLEPFENGALEDWVTYTVTYPDISCASSCPALSAFSYSQSLTRATSFGNCTALNFQPQVTYSGPALTQMVTVPVQAVNSVTTSGTTTNTTGNYFAVFTPGGATTVNVTDGQGNNFAFENTGGCTPTSNTWTLTLGPGSPTCTPVTMGNPPPTSMCTNNTLYQEYAGKTRIFNDYTDVQDYTSCINSSLTSGTQTSSTSTAAMLATAQAGLSNTETNWLSMLTNVRNTVPAFSSITDATLNTLVADLGQISSTYLQIAAQQNTAMNVVSSLPNPLPSGFSAPNGYYSFSDVFNALVPSYVSQGFSADLLGNVYPYNKVPYPADQSLVNLSPQMLFNNVSANVSAFQSAWNSSGVSTFSGYLQQQLTDDWLMTSTQLSDLQTRIANGCTTPYLANPATLPVSFLVTNPGSLNGANPWDPSVSPVSWITCGQLATLQANFQTKYTGVSANSTDPVTIQLYQTLFTNYANLQLGYPLSWADYNAFSTQTCPASSTALLYDKPQSPSVLNDVFSCAAEMLKNTYSLAGQEYTIYIDGIRLQFRNSYVSKCLSNQASANITGKQYQYHYMLYYYDQAGNLEKTVPPEGVHLLSDQDLAAIQALPAQTASSCATYPANVVTGQTAVLSDLSTDLQGNAQAMELWLFNSSGAATRSLRMVTPDGKYLVQAAIANGYVFYEEYSLTPDASGNGIDMTLTNEVVATLPSQEVLQNWTYLMVESLGGLNSGALTLYLDGNPLTNVPLASAPPYPFGFEIDGQTGGYILPATDVSQVQQIRLYQTAPQANDVLADYQNSCMNPAGNLTSAYELWGLFNPSGFCGNNTAATTLVTVPDRGSLSVAANPDPGGTLNTYAITSVTNTFTVEFWVNPSPQAQDNIPNINYLYAGVDYSPPYAIFPLYGGLATTGHANMGVAVGVNGITVFQHAANYLPAVLDWRGNVSGWTHVAVVYNNGIPSLYVNGALATTATTTSYTGSKPSVSPSYNFGGGSYGWMPGNIDEVRIWNVARTPSQIAAAYSQGLAASDVAGLAGYWPMDGTSGSIIHDVSCNGHDAALLSPADSWAVSAAPITDNTYVPFASRLIVPNHGLPTYYAYSSLNQAVSQLKPDAGQSNYLYDRLGRLVISQSAEQYQPAIADNFYNIAGRFSYTRYDGLGRVVEAGEKLGAATLAETDTRVDATLTSWYNSGSNRDVTVSAYDQAPTWAPINLPENNLRNRVAATALLSSGNNALQNRSSASYYSYDYDGNVAELTQENAALTNNEQRVVTGSTGLKDIKYDYDLISGKVNMVSYQEGEWDQFFYQYTYDADNRLINAYTSRDNTLPLSEWNNEANYRYYLHGPLGRMELAINPNTATGVQGLDYAYTLQGWLKGVNGQQVPLDGSTQTDMGGDGIAGSLFSQWPLDVMGYSLGYFNGDYQAIGSNPYLGSYYTGNAKPASGYALYNGNVTYSTYAMTPFGGSGSTSGFSGYSYKYDQLNRLIGMDHLAMAPYNGTTYWDPSKIGQNDYAETASYDGNGNILTYTRNGTVAGGQMDNLTYNYTRDVNGQLLNNKLGYIGDAANDGAYTTDIKNQPAGNYTYDANGNLIIDQQQNVGLIYWNAKGKVTQILQGPPLTQGPGTGTVYPAIVYGYDPAGNRITKTTLGTNGSSNTTHYVLDAQGKVLAVYRYNNSVSSFAGGWAEQHLYGSGRLGMLQTNLTALSSQPLANDSYDASRDATIEATGNRLYELNNHLGNVIAVVTDVTNPPGSNGNSGSAYTATIQSAQDYYPYGMQMPGRTYLAPWASSLNYRYGFNGQERSDEIAGAGNHTTAEFWEYDTRTGRRWNRDPQGKDNESPYLAFGGNPVYFSDPLGNEGEHKANQTGATVTSLDKNQISSAVYSALISIHTNTVYDRSYFVTSSTPADKMPYLGVDLYDQTPNGYLQNMYGLTINQAYDFVKTYRNYYNMFGTLGMWWGSKEKMEALFKAMGQVSPEKQYEIANAFISDFYAKNERWQQLSKAGVTFGNILMLYGGQELNVGNEVKGAFKSNIGASSSKGVNIPVGAVKFSEEATAAVNKLGVPVEVISVTNGVADLPIYYMTKASVSDLNIVFRELKSLGATAVRVNSGPIINPTITQRLTQAAASGSTFLGFDVTATGDANNMFILTKKL